MAKEFYADPGLQRLCARRLSVLDRLKLHRGLAHFNALLDVHHSEARNREVIRPLVQADPACARFISEGALMKMVSGQRCFDCYAEQLMPPSRH